MVSMLRTYYVYAFFGLPLLAEVGLSVVTAFSFLGGVCFFAGVLGVLATVLAGIGVSTRSRPTCISSGVLEGRRVSSPNSFLRNCIIVF